jgi:hypothetical protein
MYNQLALLTLLTLILGFTRHAQEGAKPPPSKGRITCEFLAGVTGGAGGIVVAVIPFYLLLYLANKFFPREPGTGPAGGPGTLPEMFAYLCFPVGYAIGSAAGVCLVGNAGNETGSFKYTLVSTSLITIGGLVALLPMHGERFIIPILLVVLVGVPVIATIVFNLTRRYKSSAFR